MRFVLTIELGNDAMRKGSHIKSELREFASKLEGGTPRVGDSGSLRDVNGNRVGSWHVDHGDDLDSQLATEARIGRAEQEPR